MDATAKDFMSEVKDNFLTCQLCGRDFDRPKTLPCMHSFCQDCLVKHAGMYYIETACDLKI